MGYEDSNEEDVRDELYGRFRYSLTKPVSERFFDEDELVEVFDLASDRNDTYIQLEVLLCGARLYPDSSALADRRALFYVDEDESNELGRRYLQDNSWRTSLLTEIAGLTLYPPSSDKAPEKLRDILDKYAVFTDEEIIRFVNAAFELGMFDWVVDNLPELRKKVNYLPALLFEVLNEADNHEEDELCIQLADELIELEPFGMQYWALLFRAQARSGHQEEARTAFDYARALGADRGQPMFWLAETVVKWANYLTDDAIQMVQEAIEAEPENFLYTDCLGALMNLKYNSADEAEKLYRKFFYSHPEQWPPLRQLLLVANPEDAEELLGMHMQAAENPSDSLKELTELIPQMAASGLYNTLTAVLRVLSALDELGPDLIEFLVEACFVKRKFDVLLRNVENYMDATDILQNPMKLLTIVPATLLSYKMTGQEEKARAFIERTHEAVEHMLHYGPLPMRFAAFGVVNLFAMSETHPASDTNFWHHFLGE